MHRLLDPSSIYVRGMYVLGGECVSRHLWADSDALLHSQGDTKAFRRWQLKAAAGITYILRAPVCAHSNVSSIQYLALHFTQQMRMEIGKITRRNFPIAKSGCLTPFRCVINFLVSVRVISS